MPSASASAIGRNAERAQNVDHEPMANAHALGQRLPLLGEEHAAIRPRGREPAALEARNGLDRGGVRNAETPGDVGRPRLAGVLQEIGDQFHVVFQQGGRLRRAGLAEAPRLGAFCGQLPASPFRLRLSLFAMFRAAVPRRSRQPCCRAE